MILIDCSSLVLEVICFVRFDEAVHFLVLLNTFGNWEEAAKETGAPRKKCGAPVGPSHICLPQPGLSSTARTGAPSPPAIFSGKAKSR